MLRGLVLALANRQRVRRIVTGGAGRRVALRFVAGEELEDARAAAEAYRSILARIEAAGLPADLSVKLTQMGLDIDPNVALGNAALVVLRAAEAGTSVTLDMEDHAYTDRTIEACLRLARVHVRLCKGAYREPRELAYQRRGDVDASFARLAQRLMESEAYPMIATHDERLARFAARCAEGYRLRVYVPFGREWYPYLVRRIAERPANVRFFLEALLRG